MNALRIIAHETGSELTKLRRLPTYVISTLAFPLGFYLFFGIVTAHGSAAERTQNATYLLATFGAFGVMAASLFGLGVGIASERGQGWLLVKRASPMPSYVYITAKVLTAAIFAVAVVALLDTAAMLFGGVRLAPLTLLAVDAASVLGAFPFCALGCAVGWLAGPNSAAAVVNIVYLPLSFLGGLWLPIAALPHAVQQIALVLPSYHLGQLALGPLGMARGEVIAHIAVLALWTVVGIGVAVLAMRSDEGRAYG
jgi:ABC-2 type transport system permease protein